MDFFCHECNRAFMIDQLCVCKKNKDEKDLEKLLKMLVCVDCSKGHGNDCGEKHPKNAKLLIPTVASNSTDVFLETFMPLVKIKLNEIEGWMIVQAKHVSTHQGSLEEAQSAQQITQRLNQLIRSKKRAERTLQSLKDFTAQLKGKKLPKTEMNGQDLGREGEEEEEDLIDLSIQQKEGPPKREYDRKELHELRSMAPPIDKSLEKSLSSWNLLEKMKPKPIQRNGGILMRNGIKTNGSQILTDIKKEEKEEKREEEKETLPPTPPRNPWMTNEPLKKDENPWKVLAIPSDDEKIEDEKSKEIDGSPQSLVLQSPKPKPNPWAQPLVPTSPKETSTSYAAITKPVNTVSSNTEQTKEISTPKTLPQPQINKSPPPPSRPPNEQYQLATVPPFYPSNPHFSNGFINSFVPIRVSAPMRSILYDYQQPQYAKEQKKGDLNPLYLKVNGMHFVGQSLRFDLINQSHLPMLIRFVEWEPRGSGVQIRYPGCDYPDERPFYKMTFEIPPLNPQPVTIDYSQAMHVLKYYEQENAEDHFAYLVILAKGQVGMDGTYALAYQTVSLKFLNGRWHPESYPHRPTNHFRLKTLEGQ